MTRALLAELVTMTKAHLLEEWTPPPSSPPPCAEKPVPVPAPFVPVPVPEKKVVVVQEEAPPPPLQLDMSDIRKILQEKFPTLPILEPLPEPKSEKERLFVENVKCALRRYGLPEKVIQEPSRYMKDPLLKAKLWQELRG